MIARASPWIFIRERLVPRTGFFMRDDRRQVKIGTHLVKKWADSGQYCRR
jgi:hypothetical protein